MGKTDDCRTFAVVVSNNGRLMGCSTPGPKDRCKRIARAFNRRQAKPTLRAVALPVVEV